MNFHLPTRATVVAMAIALLVVSQLNAAVIRVDDDSTAISPNGTTWANAYSDLQDALAVATDGDVIWLAQGEYRPGTSRSDTFQLVDGVVIEGGYNGLGAPGFEDTRVLDPELTVLTGDTLDDDDDPMVPDPKNNNSLVVVTAGIDLRCRPTNRPPTRIGWDT